MIRFSARLYITRVNQVCCPNAILNSERPSPFDIKTMNISCLASKLVNIESLHYELPNRTNFSFSVKITECFYAYGPDNCYKYVCCYLQYPRRIRNSHTCLRTRYSVRNTFILHFAVYIYQKINSSFRKTYLHS